MGLPEDLVFREILSKLPPKSLMRFRCVSKSWRTRISHDSSFIDAQQAKSDPQLIFLGWRNRFVDCRDQMVIRLSDEKSKATEIDMSYVYAKDTTVYRGSVIRIVGSCNGLVCLFQSHPTDPTERVILWNPATRHVRPLPCLLPVTGHLKLYPFIVGLGFGFDIASKDYKVVQLNRHRRSAEEPLFMFAQVFAKSGVVWRDCGVSGIAGFPKRDNAVAVEGALHWVVSFRENACHSRVASFDLHDEVLRMTDGPVDDHANIGVSLCKWSDSLTAFTYSETESLMWASTSSSGVRTWSKILKFSPRKEMGRCVWKEQLLARRIQRPCGRGWPRLVLIDRKAPHLETDLKLPDDCIIPDENAFEYIESTLSVF